MGEPYQTGMYRETPGTANLTLGSPLFPQAVVSLGSGKTITINAPAAADSTPYVQSVALGGSAWNNAYLPPSVVTSGAVLDFTLGTSANTSWASTASTAPPSYDGTAVAVPTFPSGPITSGVAGTCVDVAGASTANGTHVQLYPCNGTNAQQWSVMADGTLQAFGKCMDVVNGGMTNGTKVQLYVCNGTGSQQWLTNANGELVNPQAARCLDDPGGTSTNPTRLQIYDCVAGRAQTWTLP